MIIHICKINCFRFVIFSIFLSSFSLKLSAQEESLNSETNFTMRRILQNRPESFRGWWLPNPGNFSGNFDASVGLHFWDDHFWLRNLQFRTQFNVIKGLRINSVLRSNHEFYGIGKFEPFFDELYSEFYGFRLSKTTTFSYSLRAGRMRYSRTPFPDLISIFDVVPGVSDLMQISHPKTSFDGLNLTLDYKIFYGLGAHTAFFQDQDIRNVKLKIMEAYAYYQHSFSIIDLEARFGLLPERPTPMINSRLGGNIYGGLHFKGIRAGGLLEKLNGKSWFAGVLVQFSPSLITNILGSIHTDYTRSPQGVAFHLPLLNGNFGYVNSTEIQGTCVGEMVAERRMTFWQNSQTRNFYEHQYSIGGQIEGDSIVTVMDEYPWYLKNESPVGPLLELNSLDDILTWNNTSARLGEVAQPVVYRYYKVNGKMPKKRLTVKPGIIFKDLSRKYNYE